MEGILKAEGRSGFGLLVAGQVVQEVGEGPGGAAAHPAPAQVGRGGRVGQLPHAGHVQVQPLAAHEVLRRHVFITTRQCYHFVESLFYEVGKW